MLGLDLSHERADVFRAGFESVVFALGTVLDVMRERVPTPTRIRLSGGLTHAALVRQMVADIFGAQAVLADHDEASAFGAAAMAGLATGALRRPRGRRRRRSIRASSTTPTRRWSQPTEPSSPAIGLASTPFCRCTSGSRSPSPRDGRLQRARSDPRRRSGDGALSRRYLAGNVRRPHPEARPARAFVRRSRALVAARTGPAAARRRSSSPNATARSPASPPAGRPATRSRNSRQNCIRST